MHIQIVLFHLMHEIFETTVGYPQQESYCTPNSIQHNIMLLWQLYLKNMCTIPVVSSLQQMIAQTRQQLLDLESIFSHEEHLDN